MARSPGPSPSMAEVAKLAAVSLQTVSRVLNTPELVSPETRTRVLAAIAKLGYRRNHAARALATSHTELIGVIGTNLEYFGPASVAGAVELAARVHGFATLAGTLHSTDTDEVAHLMTSFVDRGVEGIVVIAPHDRAVAAALSVAAAVPTVLVADGACPTAGCHVVSVDQQLGARLAIEHLLGLGSGRIVCISGPLDWFDARSRLTGWRAALAAAGMPEPETIVGDWTARRGHEIGAMLAEDPPDAIVCGNDLTALGVLAALHQKGIEVPRRVKVIGFDDIDGSEYFVPPLTTVRQPFVALGRRSIEVLVEAIAGGPPRVDRIAPLLVRRGSTMEQRTRFLT
ncbi:MAG: LacI family DNA-binding transcriptional regulator [Propionibacteriaceae bacterium]